MTTGGKGCRHSRHCKADKIGGLKRTPLRFVRINVPPVLPPQDAGQQFAGVGDVLLRLVRIEQVEQFVDCDIQAAPAAEARVKPDSVNAGISHAPSVLAAQLLPNHPHTPYFSESNVSRYFSHWQILSGPLLPWPGGQNRPVVARSAETGMI